MSGWKGRGSVVTRQWQILVLLRRRPQTLAAMARELGVCPRTVYRDILALEAVPFPITRSEAYTDSTWTLGSIPEWPRNEVTHTQELRA